MSGVEDEHKIGGKAEVVKRYSTDHKHLEDHACEYRLSLQGRKDSVKDFKPVRDTTVSVV